MNDTISNVLGWLCAVLLLAAIGMAFLAVEHQLSDYTDRHCRCACAEFPKPPDSTWYNQRVWPDSEMKKGAK